MPLSHVSQGQAHVLSHNEERDGINFLAEMPPYIPRFSMTGPASTDTPTITTGVTLDGAFNESYIVSGSTLPADWPFDAWGKMVAASNALVGKTSNTAIASLVTYRFMADGPELMLMTSGMDQMDLWIDGRPYASNPVTLIPTTGLSPFGIVKLVFPSPKPSGRLIELRMIGALAQGYTKKPYRMWKPAPDLNAKIAVTGDSYVTPTTLSNTAAANESAGYWLKGVYQRMAGRLGLTSMTTDGIGGSGYIAGGGSNLPYGHASRMSWLNDIQPDVIVVHGGGANDLYTGSSVAAIIAAATTHFQNLRTQHPKAKLVFVEGVTPPLFTPATFGPNYKLIREGVQANLASAGVDAYFIDLQTTRPPLTGSGYVTAANASGNSDIYVGHDATHLSTNGNEYLSGVIAPKLARVLADKGSLVGQLIL